MGIDLWILYGSTCALCGRANDFKFRICDFFLGGIFVMKRNTAFSVPTTPCSRCLKPIPQRYALAWVRAGDWDTLALTCTDAKCRSYYRARGYNDHMSLRRVVTWGENWCPANAHCEVCRITSPQDYMFRGPDILAAYAVVEMFWINNGNNVIQLCDVCQGIFYPEAVRVSGISQNFIKKLPDRNILTCSARNEMGLF